MTNSHITIRKAVQSDLPALTEIYNYEVLNGVATLDLRPRTDQEQLDWFNSHTGCRIILVAIDETGRTAGYGSLSDYRSKDAYMSTAELSVYVSPDFRGKGIGSALTQSVIAAAKADGVTQTIVSVITAGNEASVKLHKKFGFTFCGTIHKVGYKFGIPLDIENYELMIK